MVIASFISGFAGGENVVITSASGACTLNATRTGGTETGSSNAFVVNP